MKGIPMNQILLRSCLVLSALTLVTFTGCASSVKRHDYPLTTNATEEIQNLDQEMNTAIKRQAHVLSPNHFSKAQEKLADAKEERRKGSSNSDVLEDLGYARAHLDMANSVTTKAEATIPEVIKARSDAINAGAVRLRQPEIKDADRSLTRTTSDFETGKYTVSDNRKAELKKEYMDLELSSIKAAYLDESKALIDAAKKMKAEKMAKKTLASAEAKYRQAERLIEADRYDRPKISRASDAARTEARRLLRVTELANNAKEGTPESVALEIDARQRAAEMARLESERRQQQLTETRREMGATSAENRMLSEKLTQEEHIKEAFKTAQATFSEDEAEIYRQGDNILIRLKGMEFKPGQADVPARSLSVLSKVKDVMDSMGAEKVVVEGHTDSTGSKMINEKLSESRAQAIANYLVSSKTVDEDQIVTKGFGYEKPISSNRTAMGRAQNRRVDLLISPASTKTAEVPSEE